MNATRIRTAVLIFLAITVLVSIAPKSHNINSVEAAIAPIGNLTAAIDVFSVKSGNWSDPTVWSNASVPANGNLVTITSGHAVIYDVQANDRLGMKFVLRAKPSEVILAPMNTIGATLAIYREPIVDDNAKRRKALVS